jgi:hypothetical protein
MMGVIALQVGQAPSQLLMPLAIGAHAGSLLLVFTAAAVLLVPVFWPF